MALSRAKNLNHSKEKSLWQTNGVDQAHRNLHQENDEFCLIKINRNIV